MTPRLMLSLILSPILSILSLILLRMHGVVVTGDVIILNAVCWAVITTVFGAIVLD